MPLPDFIIKGLQDANNWIGNAVQGTAERFANPMTTLAEIAAAAEAARAQTNQLQAAAFQDPQHPFRVTNQEALSGLIDKGMAGTSFAPSGIFAGVASKTMNPKTLMEASTMARGGALPEEIWKATGWAKAPWDKQWRYEINDQNLALGLHRDPAKSHVMRSDPFEPIPSTAALPELYRAYPNIAHNRANLTIDPDYARQAGKPAVGGWYAPGPATQGYRGGQIELTSNDRGRMYQGVMHELQHAVQAQQGWQGGGSPAQFVSSKSPFQGPMAQFDPVALDKYKRLAGEAEARLTEARQPTSAWQRQNSFPYDPEYFEFMTGVPLDRLLTMLPGGRK